MLTETTAEIAAALTLAAARRVVEVRPSASWQTGQHTDAARRERGDPVQGVGVECMDLAAF